MEKGVFAIEEKCVKQNSAHFLHEAKYLIDKDLEDGHTDTRIVIAELLGRKHGLVKYIKSQNGQNIFISEKDEEAIQFIVDMSKYAMEFSHVILDQEKVMAKEDNKSDYEQDDYDFASFSFIIPMSDENMYKKCPEGIKNGYYAFYMPTDISIGDTIPEDCDCYFICKDANNKWITKSDPKLKKGRVFSCAEMLSSGLVKGIEQIKSQE